jgi:threonine dehydrogenase-like Zn-dependent dehydrogenase
MGSPNMNPIVLKMMESGKVDFTQMITQVIPLSEARLALDDLKANSGSRIKILLQP